MTISLEPVRAYDQAYMEIRVEGVNPRVSLEFPVITTVLRRLDSKKIKFFEITPKKRGFYSFNQYRLIFEDETELKIGVVDQRTIYLHVSMLKGKPREFLDKVLESLVKELETVHESFLQILKTGDC